MGKVLTLCQSNFGDEHSLSKIISSGLLYLSKSTELHSNASKEHLLSKSPISSANTMHMLLNLNILLYTSIIPLCKLLNTKHLCTKFLGIMHLSCHFQTLHIKCLCTKGLLCHIFWNYVRPDSRLGGDT